MNRRTDIGWTELIFGLALIVFGVIMLRQPAGVLTWLVVICGIIAIFTGIGDIILYVKMERFTGFSCNRYLKCYDRIYASCLSGSRYLGTGNGTPYMDHCTLYFQTFSSELCAFQTGNYLLLSYHDR